jgi:hypothetical protein
MIYHFMILSAQGINENGWSLDRHRPFEPNWICFDLSADDPS